MSTITCRPKPLTPSQTDRAIRRSLEVNPANAAEHRVVMRTPTGRRGGLRRLAVVIAHKWPAATGAQLTVQFLDNPKAELRRRIIDHMNAWSKTANVRFTETEGTGQVRIARLDRPEDMSGYWSYVGTEILGIEEDQPTMNLEGFTMRTPEAEFKRVVRHEAGHTLGFEHEHMRAALINKIDRRKAIAYFDRTEGWTEEETIEQVLTPLSRASIMGTAETDPHSVMCYQIPRAITKDGKAIPGGSDITAKDFAFAAKIYPMPERGREAATPERSTQAAALLLPSPTVVHDDDTFHLVVMDRFDPDGDASGSPAKTSSKKKAKTPKYAQIFASYGGARVTVPLRLKTDKGEAKTRWGSIIGFHENIQKYTNRVEGLLPEDEEMVGFGTDLFETLFQGDVRRLYDEARSRQHGRKLDFVLTSMVPWIAEKPWEFAYDASRRSFLATEDLHFVRNVLTAIPADVLPAQRDQLHILVASAQPAGFGRLSIEQETAVIRRGFEGLIAAGLATVEVLPRATPSAIHAKLSTGRFNVVHFIGHGTFDEDAEEGALVFENERGGEFLLGERSVREIFCQRGVSLVFLNACQSGSGGRADFNKGIAQSLVAHGLPALVANQYSVLDTSATQFAQQFYWALAQGMSIGQASREARIAVNYSLQGEIIDWAIPVVYARDPGMTLCARRSAPDVAPLPTVRAQARRSVERRPFEVAVWDIDSVFPALGSTVERMSAAQKQFGFELVDLSAPLDAWDNKKAEDGQPYLWAERLANRLERIPVELNVNVLACITRHWMRSDDYFNIYGWWPIEDGQPRVLIFSCAGFDALPPEGPQTDRVLANAMVSALTGYLTRLDSHKRGARNCPMAFNAKRDFAYMAGEQVFEAKCRRELTERIPRELPALEKLLKVFR